MGEVCRLHRCIGHHCPQHDGMWHHGVSEIRQGHCRRKDYQLVCPKCLPGGDGEPAGIPVFDKVA